MKMGYASLYALVASLALMSPATAQSVYFKSAETAETWKPAATALADAQYLKIYDEELKRVAADGEQMDLAVAKLGAAGRDDTISDVLERDRSGPKNGVWPAKSAGEILGKQVDDDLSGLFGPNLPSLDKLPTLEETLSSKARRRADYEDEAVDQRRKYEAGSKAVQVKPVTVKGDKKGQRPDAPPGPAPLDTSCENLGKMSAAVRTTTVGAVTDDAARAALKRLIVVCGRIEKIRGEEKTAVDPFVADGALKEAYDALVESRKKASPQSTDALVADLAKTLKDAENSGKHDQDALKKFREKIGTDLSKLRPTGEKDAAGKDIEDVASPMAKELALGRLSDLVDAYLRADVCDAGDKATKDLRDAAKCDEIPRGGATDKIQATWGFLNALALVSDATSPATRSAQWMAGAKAIIAAAKADAQLQTEYAKTVTRHREARFRALIAQAASLAQVREKLNGKKNCADRVACAIADYVDAADRGAIPAEIHAWREIYAEREAGIRRERALADKERQLLLAAAAQMQAAVDGGIDPKIVAEAFKAIGITLIAL